MSGTGGARENVFPTRMALTNIKLRLKGAQTGHSLLAKKRDALSTRFRTILKKVDTVSNNPENTSLLIQSSLTLDSYLFFVSSAQVGKTPNGKSNATSIFLTC